MKAARQSAVCDCGQKKPFPDAAAHLGLHHIAAGFKDFQDVKMRLVFLSSSLWVQLGRAPPAGLSPD